MKLPDEIQQVATQLLENGQPLSSVRAIGTINNQLGESYALADSRRLLVFSRPVGKAYAHHYFALRDIPEMELVDDPPYLILEFNANNRKYQLKFTSFDRDEITKLTNFWQKAPDLSAPDPLPTPSAAPVAAPEPTAASASAPTPTAEAATAAAAAIPVAAPLVEPRDPAPTAEPVPATAPAKVTAEEEVTPLVGFAAGLYAMIQADTIIDAEENLLFCRLISDPEIRSRGIQLWQQLGTEKILQTLHELLTPEQRLCLLANAIEIAMIDGTLRSIEKENLKWFRRELDIDSEEMKTIFQVLMIKNNLGIFQLD